MRKISIGHVGLSHLKAMLKDELGLCAKIIQCPFDQGECSTFVPAGTKTYDVSKPQSGGLLSASEANKVFTAFPQYLRDCVSKFSRGTLIVQSPWSQTSDAVPRDLNDERLLQAGFGVCHTCRIEGLSEDEFDFLIGDTIAMRYVACIIGPAMTVAAACSSADHEFWDAVNAVFVPAYDGESIIMWERNA